MSLNSPNLTKSPSRPWSPLTKAVKRLRPLKNCVMSWEPIYFVNYLYLVTLTGIITGLWIDDDNNIEGACYGSTYAMIGFSAILMLITFFSNSVKQQDTNESSSSSELKREFRNGVNKLIIIVLMYFLVQFLITLLFFLGLDDVTEAKQFSRTIMNFSASACLSYYSLHREKKYYETRKQLLQDHSQS